MLNTTTPVKFFVTINLSLGSAFPDRGPLAINIISLVFLYLQTSFIISSTGLPMRAKMFWGLRIWSPVIVMYLSIGGRSYFRASYSASIVPTLFTITPTSKGSLSYSFLHISRTKFFSQPAGYPSKTF